MLVAEKAQSPSNTTYSQTLIDPSLHGSGVQINPVMENHIKLTSGISSNSYLRAFQVAQFNFFLFNQEEQMKKKRFKVKGRRKEG